MGSYRQSLHQIVFSTKNRVKSLSKNNRIELYRYIYGFCLNKRCHLYRVGGVEDHIHIILALHPSVRLADFVRQVKISTVKYIRQNNLFPEFDKWQNGYGSFTYHIEAKNNLINYVKNQEVHHKKTSFRNELISLLNEHGVDFDEEYLD